MSKHPTLTMPSFVGMKAFVLPGAFYGDCVMLMAEAGFTRADSVEDADVVVFIGGADINPALYGQKPMAQIYFSQQRDDEEVAIYHQAQKLGKVCFGICRGMQLLAALNGAQLWQHITNHAGNDHLMYCVDEDISIEVTSVHHQMVQYDRKIEVIGCTYEAVASEFNDETRTVFAGKGNNDVVLEIEAGYIDETKCFFVQGHPEIGEADFRAWTMSRLYERMEEWNALPIIDIPPSQLIPVRGSC